MQGCCHGGGGTDLHFVLKIATDVLAPYGCIEDPKHQQANVVWPNLIHHATCDTLAM